MKQYTLTPEDQETINHIKQEIQEIINNKTGKETKQEIQEKEQEIEWLWLKEEIIHSKYTNQQ